MVVTTALMVSSRISMGMLLSVKVGDVYAPKMRTRDRGVKLDGALRHPHLINRPLHIAPIVIVECTTIRHHHEQPLRERVTERT